MTDSYVRNAHLKIDTKALKNNLEVLKGMLPRGIRQMAVVKANAYGHGSIEVAKTLEEDVAWFAVNDVDEGIELRDAGIENPILVFGVPTTEISSTYTNYNLTATVSSLSHFGILEEGTEYHLNFDTGMGRLGLQNGDVTELKQVMSEYSELRCTGLYSHFATAEDPDSAKANQQLSLFKDIRSRFDSDLLAHMANTGGTAFYPDSHFDMVRNGIGIYGYKPGKTPIDGLQPVMSWHSEVVQVKRFEKGATVSYGARWTAPGDCFVGVIPVGYEEGVPRTLTGNLQVVVEGELYPVVGTVTMNYIMVNFGDSNPGIGTSVELFGQEALTAADWADRAGTIPYEIVSGISQRIPRRYTS